MRLQVPGVRDDQLPVNADDDDNCSTDNHGTTIAPHGNESCWPWSTAYYHTADKILECCAIVESLLG